MLFCVYPLYVVFPVVTIWIFIWFESIVPIFEKSFGSLVLLIGVVYLFASIVGVTEYFLLCEFEYLVGSHFCDSFSVILWCGIYPLKKQ